MKTYFCLFLIILSLFFQVPAFSQIVKPITKGNMKIGGSLGVTYYHASENGQIDYSTFIVDSKSTTNQIGLYFSPSFGYFVADGLLLGISLGLDYYNENFNYTVSSPSEYHSDSKFKYFFIGAYPYIKYYFKNGLFLNLDAGYALPINNSGDSDRSSSSEISISPCFGYAIFLTSKVSFEPSISYEYRIDFNTRSSESSESSSTSQKHAIYLSAGFNYFF
jgi:hypothetical protein